MPAFGLRAEHAMALRLRGPTAVAAPRYPCDSCPGCLATIMNGVGSDSSDALLQRIYGEFLEMPGLGVTVKQANRLWGVDETTCARVLDLLVGCAVLQKTRRGVYARAADGPVPCPRAKGAETPR